MRQYRIALPLAIALVAPAAIAHEGVDHVAEAAIAKAVADPARTPANRQRDAWRHPAQTLGFFGVKPDQTVVEFIPSGGWYTEILAPLLKDKGHYVTLTPGAAPAQEKTAAMLAQKAPWLPKDANAAIDLATGKTNVAPGSADVVLTFRNVHNLIMGDDPARATNAFAAFFTILKPGGTLGIVDHRLPEARDSAEEKKSGYIKRSTILALAEKAGFQLVAEPEINANPKDKADYPDGVWTLPPTLKKGDVDRARYLAIGESDRQTLKFMKPKS